MKNKLVSLYAKLSTSAVVLASSTMAVSAQETWETWVNKVKGPRAEGDLQVIIIDLLNWGIGLTALVAVVMLIWNGIRYITANGDEDKIKGATKGITYAIIGLVICFFSILIVNFVIKNIVGI
ncbi:MAG TPA: pilin [Candidatus Dojkabacteria bacterium]|nr:pilin [Candidatus Dojkabacteria bacterium]